MNSKGITLIEVLAALVIISIVIGSFMQIFVTTNKISVNNNEKLLVINLADAYLERLKLEDFNIIPPPSVTPDYLFRGTNQSTVFKKTYNKLNCSASKFDCEYFSIIVNNKMFDVTVIASQNYDESLIELINVEVSVTKTNSNLSSSVEGYLSHE